MLLVSTRDRGTLLLLTAAAGSGFAALLYGCSGAERGLGAAPGAERVDSGRRGSGSAIVATAGAAPSAATPRALTSAAALRDEPTGAGAAAATQGEVEARLWSQEYLTWIWPKPEVGGRFLGTIRVGQSVRLRSAERVVGQNCSRGFFAIEPRGYVCWDRTVTLEPGGPFLRAVAHTLPRSGPFPYDYALSNGAPMYARVPTGVEQKRNEWRYPKAGEWVPLPKFQRGHEQLAVLEPISPRDPIPEFLASGGSARGPALELLRRSIPHGSMLSFTRAFAIDGRTFVLSTDLTVVPADRIRMFRPSSFRGVRLGSGGAELPLGWLRASPKPEYRRAASGRIEPTGASWPVRSFVRLGGSRLAQEGREYVPVSPPASSGAEGSLADLADLTVVRRETERPFGVPAGSKWIVVSISSGTLVAYDDLTPVFATLVSPGQGGVPIAGRDHVKDSTTPLGPYRITFKDRAATMSPEMGEDRTFWIADVPHTQYFNPPFALHATYWHERFGEPMSAGCINASPIDAEWLFGWTLPLVPEGWHGATGAGAPENGGASFVVVRR
jgi:hypothetical protein